MIKVDVRISGRRELKVKYDDASQHTQLYIYIYDEERY
jgi:hypothetical protein